MDEQALLGAVIIDGSCFESAYEILSKDIYFEAKEHQLIYRAMISLYLDGVEIDLASISSKLMDTGKLKEVGAYYLATLTNLATVSANVKFYASRILEAYATRATRLAGKEIAESTDLEAITSKAEQILELSELNVLNSRPDFKAIAESYAARKLDISSVVPPILFRFLKSVATHAYSNFPVEATFTHLLSVVAGLAGSHFVLIRDGRPTKLILSSIVNMDSSLGKSENLELLIKPLENKQSEYHTRYLEELKIYNKNLERYRKFKKEDSSLEEPEKPTEKTILTTKATTEALIKLLAANPNGILYAKDEISGVFSGMNEYKRGTGSDKDTMLELLAGQSIIKHTVSNESEQAYGARLSLTGGIQPAKMDEWLKMLSVDDGFWGRFIFFTERNNYTVLTPREQKISIDIDIVGNFYEAIIEESQVQEPVHFFFEDEQQIDYISEFLNDEKNASPNVLKNYIGKCFNFFQRIAVVLHLIHCYYSNKPLRTKHISSDTVSNAFLVTAFYIAQAKSLFIGEEQSPKEKLIKSILEVPLEARSIEKLNTTIWRKHDEDSIFKDQKKKAEKLRKLFQEMEDAELGTIDKLSDKNWQFILKGEK